MCQQPPATAPLLASTAHPGLERVRAKWMPVRVKKHVKTTGWSFGSDSIRTDFVLAGHLPTNRRPYQGEPLPLKDLPRCHLRGYRITKPAIKIAFTPGGARCGEIEPGVGQNNALRHAVTAVVTQAEPALCKGIALRRGASVEIGGCDIVLRHAETVFVHEAELRLRPGIALRRRRNQLADGAGIVASVVGGGAAGQPVGAGRAHHDADQQDGKKGRRQLSFEHARPPSL